MFVLTRYVKGVNFDFVEVRWIVNMRQLVRSTTETLNIYIKLFGKPFTDTVWSRFIKYVHP